MKSRSEAKYYHDFSKPHERSCRQKPRFIIESDQMQIARKAWELKQNQIVTEKSIECVWPAGDKKRPPQVNSPPVASPPSPILFGQSQTPVPPPVSPNSLAVMST